MILNFKSTLFAISSLLLFWTATGTAAPACQHVLQSLTAEQINATLDKLAQLRMELDLEKANGLVKTTSKRLEKDYREKIDQAVSAMNIDQATLQKELQQRIEQLQTGKNKEDQSERKDRSTEAQTMKLSLIYNLESQVLDIATSNSSDIRAAFYLPKSNSLFYYYYNHLHRLDIDPRNIEPQPDASTNIEVNQAGTQLFELTKKGNLTTTDLTTGITDHQVPLQLSQEDRRSIAIGKIAGFSVSPSGKKVAVALRRQVNGDALLIFDTASGALLKELEGSTSGIMKFWTENEIILSRKSTIKKLNINTEVLTTSSIAAGTPSQLSLNAESNTIFFSDVFGNLKSFTGDTLKLLEETKQFKDGRIAEIPGRPDLIAMFAPQSRKTNNAQISGIYRRDDLTHPIFDFGGEYLSEKKIPFDIVISKDLSKIFIFYSEFGKFKIHADIWAREQVER